MISRIRLNALLTAPTINYDELKKFENKDYQVLRNGLDKDENEILFGEIP